MGRDFRAASTVLRAVIALAAIAATLMWGRLAHAGAAPVQLILLYMPSVSNSRPSTATGVAEIVMSEGEVRIKTADLPRLDGDQQYLAWVVNSSTNDFQRLGSFNTAAGTHPPKAGVKGRSPSRRRRVSSEASQPIMIGCARAIMIALGNPRMRGLHPKLLVLLVGNGSPKVPQGGGRYSLQKGSVRTYFADRWKPLED